MKKWLLTGAAFGALIVPAAAADVAPFYKTPPAAPVYAWAGWYAGVNVGSTFESLDTVTTTSNSTFIFADAGATSLSAAVTGLSNVSALAGKEGFVGGGQIGYNWVSDIWVAGIEADIQAMPGKGSTSVAGSVGVTGFPNTVVQSASVSHGIDYLGTVRGRAGFLFTPSLLVYGTGGLAYGGVDASTNIAQSLTGPSAVSPTAWAGAGPFSGTRVGWTAGAGFEWMFWSNWSTKVEYLRYDLGTVTYGVSPLVTGAAVASPFTANALQSATSFNGNIVRAGLNYHF